MLTERVMYHLKHLQQALRTAIDEALKEVGLTSAQYGTLTALETMPQASSAALARACFVTAQTMNDIVQGLLAAGLVTRQPHPEHRRIVQLSLTEEGQGRLQQAHVCVEAVEAKMLAGLKLEEQSQFALWLKSCIYSLKTISGNDRTL